MAAEPAAPLDAAVAWLGRASEGLDALLGELAARGWRCRRAADLPELLAEARRSPPDLVVIDADGLGLPLPGVLRALRRSPRRRELPILVLASSASAEQTAEALRAGADDVLAKPLPADLLSERFLAALRTARQFARPEPWSRHLLRTRDGKLVVNTRDHRCQLQEGLEYREVPLTRRQFLVLASLLKHPNRAVRWQDLFRAGWKPSKLQKSSRTLVQHVMRVRQALGELGRRLETVPGIGYRWID